jgi:hypothetical protein
VLRRALVLLENSCFACSENEAHLVEIEITRGVAPLVARMGIAQWLVQQIQALSSQPLVLGLKKASGSEECCTALQQLGAAASLTPLGFAVACRTAFACCWPC